MADKKIALDLEVNIKKGDMTLGELNKQLQDLGDNIQEQKDILIEFEKNYSTSIKYKQVPLKLS